MQMLHYWNPIKKAITFIIFFFLFWQINLIIVVTSSSSSSSSSNSNNNNNGQLIGIPTPVTDAFEGRVYTYYIKLSKRPYSSSIPSVNVNVNIIDQGDNGGDLKLFCSLADTTLNQKQFEFSFETWDIPIPVNVKVATNDYTLRKYSPITTCRINHKVTSEDALYYNHNDTLLNISIVSRGCGLGEYHGIDRLKYVTYKNTNMGENECICGPQYYKSNDVTNCTNCNLKEGIVCNQIGVGNMPPIVKNFWRYGLPNRNDIENIYKCPYDDTCIGGNNTENRCSIGHHEQFPLCAKCEIDYVLINEKCILCNGTKSYNEKQNIFTMSTILPVHSLKLMYILLGSTIMLIFVFVLYITKRAISKEAEEELKAKLIGLNLDTIFNSSTEHHLTMDAFINMLNAHHENFSIDEIHLLFQTVDKDQTGHIDKMHLLLYATNSGWVDVENIERKRKAYKWRIKRNKKRNKLLGTAYMKFKLLFTYLQILSIFGITFSNTIKWPRLIKRAMGYLEFTTFDLYSFPFAEFIDCHMYVSFLHHFIYNVAIFPAIILLIVSSYGIGIAYRKLKKRLYKNSQDKSKTGSVKYTNDSMVANIYTMISFTAYVLYTGVLTRMIQMLTCTKFITGNNGEAKYFLNADFSIQCYNNDENNYWTFFALSLTCCVFYGLGYPAVQLILLHHNRKYLYYDEEENMKRNKTLRQEDEFIVRRHRAVKKRLGATYSKYNPDSYYFEIVDLLRRFILCGILLFLNNIYNSNPNVLDLSIIQMLCGIFICFAWVLAIAYKRPYTAYWDNILSLTLSAHLCFLLLVGMCLTLWDAKHGPLLSSDIAIDDNNGVSHYFLMVTIFLLSSMGICMIFGFVLLFISMSCTQHLKCCASLYNHLMTEEEQDQQDQVLDHFEYASEWLDSQKQILGIMTADDVVDSLSECKKVLMKTLENEENHLQESFDKWNEKLQHHEKQHNKLSFEIDELKKVLENPSLSGKLKVVTKKELDEKIDALMKNAKAQAYAAQETKEYKNKIKEKGNRGKMIKKLKAKKKKMVKAGDIYKGGSPTASSRSRDASPTRNDRRFKGRSSKKQTLEPSILPSCKELCTCICFCCCNKRKCDKCYKQCDKMLYKRKTIIGPNTHEIRDVISVRNNDDALFGKTQKKFIVGEKKIVKKKRVKIRSVKKRKKAVAAAEKVLGV